MAILGDRSTWAVSNEETRMQKGKLVRVRHPDGHYSKMHEQDAIAAGLLPGGKALPEGENKMLPPAQGNKGMHTDIPADKSADPPAPPAPDDFTTIAGIGPATARLLVAKGITTFADLRNAKSLTFLGKPALAAIEAWRAA